MSRVTIERNSRAAKICKEWALDFKQRQMPEDVSYWERMRQVYKQGGSITEAEKQRLITELEARAETGQLAAAGILGAGPVADSLVEIGREAAELLETI